MNEPAKSIGPIFAELAEEYAGVTGTGRLQDVNFVMHKQHVDYRRYGIAYRCTGGVLETRGSFRETSPRQFVFESPAENIHAKLDGAFGIEFRFVGAPLGRLLPARVVVNHPGGESLYPTLIYLGLKENFVWKFDTPEELIPGTWHIAVELFDAASPTDYPFHGTLEPKSCIARLEQVFDVWV
ncbi:MAG: hypothetical protein ABI548_19830 [Polyangiaceae bacterium]